MMDKERIKYYLEAYLLTNREVLDVEEIFELQRLIKSLEE